MTGTMLGVNGSDLDSLTGLAGSLETTDYSDHNKMPTPASLLQ